MRIAIIGAGVSGLSCAFELEKLGIRPDIFEKNKHLGDPLDYISITLKTFYPSRHFSLTALKEKHGLDLFPAAYFKKLVIKGPGKETTARGNLGYLFHRGQQYKDSLPGQLARNISTEINFGHRINIHKIRKKYDSIVVCSGSADIPKEIGLWTTTYDGYVRVTTVKGNFDTTTIFVWFNTIYSKQSYAYLVPDTSNEARLILVVDKIERNELKEYWDRFFSYENLDYKVKSIRDYHHVIGYVKSVKYENIYICGLSGGFIDDIFGFGGIKSIFSGIYAAKSIVKEADYKESVRPLLADTKRKHEYREIFNRFDNDDINNLLSFLSKPLVKYIIFKNPVIKTQSSVNIARLLNRIKK